MFLEFTFICNRQTSDILVTKIILVLVLVSFRAIIVILFS